MVKLLIIADDFTGALDTGVQFAKQGIDAWMTTDLNTDLSDIRAEVLSVDAETRIMSPEAAYRAVLGLAEAAKKAKIPMIFKKTDSTLRGNIGAELSALAVAFRKPVAFVPAYPKNGRVTKKAVQYANGLKIAETGLSRDPVNPVRHSYIPDIIAETSDIRVIAGNALEDGCVTVFDAESDGDMADIFAYLSHENALGLTAGCAGFAGVLAASSLFDKKLKPVGRRAGCTLAVCGSVNEASARQAEKAEKEGYPVFTLPAKLLLGADEEVLLSIAKEIGGALASSGFALIRTDGDRSLSGDAPEKISRAVGKLTRILAQSSQAGHLILFGGHTANAVMREIGLNGFRPRAEILPGVVYSETGLINLVTKAGGFGGENVVKEILDYIDSL